jgi:D-arabinose 5-phosphate isomerase GutQ
MASSSTPVVNPLCSQTISEKLTKSNHTLWKMQVLAVIMGVGLEGYLTRHIAAGGKHQGQKL